MFSGGFCGAIASKSLSPLIISTFAPEFDQTNPNAFLTSSFEALSLSGSDPYSYSAVKTFASYAQYQVCTLSDTIRVFVVPSCDCTLASDESILGFDSRLSGALVWSARIALLRA